MGSGDRTCSGGCGTINSHSDTRSENHSEPDVPPNLEPEDTLESAAARTNQEGKRRSASCGSASWIVIAVLLAIGIVTSPTGLECERAEAGGRVNCVKQASILWIIPLPRQEIDDVRSALLDQWVGVDDEGDRADYFRIALTTGRGRVPLTQVYYAYDWRKKQELVDRINGFLMGQEPGRLAVSEGGFPSLQDVAVVTALIVLPFVLVGYVWRWMKAVWKRRDRIPWDMP